MSAGGYNFPVATLKDLLGLAQIGSPSSVVGDDGLPFFRRGDGYVTGYAWDPRYQKAQQKLFSGGLLDAIKPIIQAAPQIMLNAVAPGSQTLLGTIANATGKAGTKQGIKGLQSPGLNMNPYGNEPIPQWAKDLYAGKAPPVDYATRQILQNIDPNTDLSALLNLKPVTTGAPIETRTPANTPTTVTPSGVTVFNPIGEIQAGNYIPGSGAPVYDLSRIYTPTGPSAPSSPTVQAPTSTSGPDSPVGNPTGSVNIDPGVIDILNQEGVFDTDISVGGETTQGSDTTVKTDVIGTTQSGIYDDAGVFIAVLGGLLSDNPDGVDIVADVLDDNPDVNFTPDDLETAINNATVTGTEGTGSGDSGVGEGDAPATDTDLDVDLPETEEPLDLAARILRMLNIQAARPLDPATRQALPSMPGVDPRTFAPMGVSLLGG